MTRGSISGALAAVLAVGLIGLAHPADAASCTERANQCDATCSSRPPVEPYAGPYDRCAASCQPRWHQCLRTGVWQHLEDERPGWFERVGP